MHKDVQVRANIRRKKATGAHNKATNIVMPNFSIGDLALVRRATDRGQKLQLKWVGPRRIGAVHRPLLYGTRFPNGKSTERVHCIRHILYRDDMVSKEI